MKAIPLPPRGMTIDQIQQYSRMRGRGEGARRFLEDVERLAVPEDDNTLRGDALESLVRLVLSIDPKSLLGSGQLTNLAHTSVRRASENVEGWTREDLWRRDKEVLRAIDPVDAKLLEDGRGSGFDLVGTYIPRTAEQRFVVQCKNTESAPVISDINAAAAPWPGGKHVWKRLLIGHRGKLSAPMLEVAKSKDVTCISRDELCEKVTAEFWYRWAKGLREGNLEREADNERIPAPYGAVPEATEAVLGTLGETGGTRTNVSMATGTGKTRVGADVARALATGGRVVVAVPTRELADQTIKHWSRYTPSDVRLKVGLLSSSTGANPLLRRQGPDREREMVPIDTFLDRDEGDSTLAEWWQAPVAPDEISLLVTTYHSSWRMKSLCQANPADLLIVDEAHHTGGARSAPVSRRPETYSTRNLLDDKELRARRRLFMTATPRDSGPINPPDLDAGVSMECSAQYGRRAYSISLGEAKERGLVKRYRVRLDVLLEDPTYTGDSRGILSAAISKDLKATSSMHGNELHVVVARRPSGDLASLHTDKSDTDTLEAQKARARALAILHTHAQAAGKHKRAVLFLGRVSEAREAEEFINKNLGEMTIDGSPITAFRLTGDVHIRQRRESLESSANNEGPTVLIVVRAGQEGIDLPQVDQLTFGTNTKSQEGILQKVGRGVRLDKRAGAENLLDVYLPVLARQDEHGNVVITDEGRRDTAFKLQAALASVDPTYENDFDAMLKEIEAELERQQKAISAEAAIMRTRGARAMPGGEAPTSPDVGLTKEVATLSLRGLASQLSYIDIPPSARDALREARRREINEVAEGIRTQIERDPTFVVPFSTFRGSKSPDHKQRLAEMLECSVATLESVVKYARGVTNERISTAAALAFGEDWETLVRAGLTADPIVQVNHGLYREIERRMLASEGPGYRIPGNPKGAKVKQWPDNGTTTRARRDAIDTVYAERTGGIAPKMPAALLGLDQLYRAMGETGDEVFGMAMRRICDGGKLYRNGEAKTLLNDTELAVAEIAKERGCPFATVSQPWGDSLKATLALIRRQAGRNAELARPGNGTLGDRVKNGSGLAANAMGVVRAGILGSKGAWSPYYPLETLLVEEFGKLKQEEGEEFPLTAEIVDGILTRLQDEGRFVDTIVAHMHNGKLNSSIGCLPGPIIAMAIKPLPDSLPVVRALRAIIALPQFADQREALERITAGAEDPLWERNVASFWDLYPIEGLAFRDKDGNTPEPVRRPREARLAAMTEAMAKNNTEASFPTPRSNRHAAPAG